MDKLNLAIEIFVKNYKDDIDVPKIFDNIDKLESESIKRFIYIPDNCPKCNTKLNLIDLSTGPNKDYRAKCDCTDALDKTLNGAVEKWWGLVND